MGTIILLCLACLVIAVMASAFEIEGLTYLSILFFGLLVGGAAIASLNAFFMAIGGVASFAGFVGLKS
jgi:hypothetical protein